MLLILTANCELQHQAAAEAMRTWVVVHLRYLFAYPSAAGTAFYSSSILTASNVFRCNRASILPIFNP